MNPPQTRRPRRVRAARGAGAALIAGLRSATLAALAAGCGGSSASDTPAAGATPTAIQVLAKATRGDLTQSVMGAAKVEKAGGKTVVVATIDAQNAASVAAGQSATVLFFSGSQSGMPQPGASGMPVRAAPAACPCRKTAERHAPARRQRHAPARRQRHAASHGAPERHAPGRVPGRSRAG